MEVEILKWSVVVFQEQNATHGDWWIAQCLEHDINAQARSFAELPNAFQAAFVANLAWGLKNEQNLLEKDNWVRAPERYWERFAQANKKNKAELKVTINIPEEVRKSSRVKQAEAVLALV
jgi:hypothetical protein